MKTSSNIIGMKNTYTLEDLNAANSRIINLYCQWVKKKGINYNTFLVLYVLYASDGVSQKYLSSRCHIIKQTVNNIVKSLDEAGYLKVETSSNNYKEQSITLNTKGKKYAKSILSELLEIEEHVVTRFGKENISQMAELSIQFGDLLQKEMQ